MQVIFWGRSGACPAWATAEVRCRASSDIPPIPELSENHRTGSANERRHGCRVPGAPVGTARGPGSTLVAPPRRPGAALRGQTVAAFVTSAVQDAAQRTMEDAQVTRLNRDEFDALVRALDAEAMPNPALRAAAARHRSRAPGDDIQPAGPLLLQPMP